MAERTVVGVDFSGAKDDAHKGNTWVTEGRVDGKVLTIDDCRAISRNGLKTLLADLPRNSVAAMDFPFGIPREFIQHLGIDATTMPDVWNNVTGNDKDVGWFGSKCNECYEALGYEAKRKGDEDHRESMSPLNLRMFRMTFHGMSMLGKLWNETKCQVPPLQEAERNGPILLETMPGAVLLRIGFPYKLCKEYKHPVKGPAIRKEMLGEKEMPSELEQKSGISLQNLSTFRDRCIKTHDCLDSLIAAIAAALWASDETLFYRPEDDTDPDVFTAAQLEGLIYAPKKKPSGDK